MNPILCRAALLLVLQHVHPAPDAAPAPAPPGTLAEDAFDRPSATAVLEAQRASAMSHEMDQSPYVHVDADRVPDAQASGREGNAAAPPPDPHAGHHLPADHP